MKRLFLILLLFIFSCRSQLEVSDFSYHTPNEIQLPKLSIQYDEEGLKRAFQLYQNQSFLLTTIDSLPNQALLTTGLDRSYLQAYYDSKIFLENSMPQLMMDGPVAGYAEWNIPVFIENIRNQLVLHTLLLGVPSLLGLPAVQVKQDLQLVLNIKDQQGNVLKTFRSTGTGKASLALYYGYISQNAASRKAFLKAMHTAYSDILAQLAVQQTLLSEQLQKK